MSFDEIIATGTSFFCPTVVTAPMSTYAHVLPILAKVSALPEYSDHVLGLHLEGPFISSKPGAVGCHRPEHTRLPDVAFLKDLHKHCNGLLKILTIAAELAGAEELTKACVELGIVVSLGHQLADVKDIRRVVEAGATMMTHLGNGMPNEAHRHNSNLLAGMSEDLLTAGIITDGFHLPPHVIKVIIRAKSLERVFVVSDAAPVAGLEPGIHQCFGKNVLMCEEEHGFVVRDSVLPCLAGSAASMLQCVNYLRKLDLLTLDELWQVSFHNPLRAIGVDPAAKLGLNMERLVDIDADDAFVVRAS